MGGLDNYILYTKDHKLDSLFGLQLKERLKEVYELKHGVKFQAKAAPAVSVKDQWQQIIDNYNRKKEGSSSSSSSTASATSSPPPVAQREQSEVV
ncbi:ribosomal protein L28, putative [Acanthamoeba castellanii str. Neff]|uniref:Ribosomal protein L28, putative n=1 Tax=Acanthamoeba castellanii (strain ATCC 30010 / Neff) TaxID=1257118 RepID=L8HM88_ACACF|nr:ribosomal protein L28, putative [Acanthamoeba castellanii str. Neff]ELR25506.1 ribosomal protein L28, putative [Acanthamoeba castellanii str. Neff]